MNKDTITPLTVKTFLSEGEYRIPIYQRNYDWGEKETLQLIEDIADYASNNGNGKYYIGSVVVFVRSRNGHEYFETIDGQQRLTTLTIMMYVLKTIKETEHAMSWFVKANLSYDHRKDADDAIANLSKGLLSGHPAGVNISDVYRIIKKNIGRIVSEKSLKLTSFVDFLLNNVIIMRIPLPNDTELNHYFEIMNSRGEQLEKHEVLKASLMDYLEVDRATMCLFNDIWEACSDMDTYVQMKMRPALRSLVFSENWSSLQYDDFDLLLDDYRKMDDSNEEENDSDEYKSRSLTQLFKDAENNIKYNLPAGDGDSADENERFGSIINFPNFLLQALKIMYNADQENYDEAVNDTIRLDDKRLIDIFQTVMSSYDKGNRTAFVKRYIMALLRLRFYFDKYVIKRENYNNRDGWSLKMLKKYAKSKVNYIGTFSQKDSEYSEDGISKDILMLEAMFHVSAPTQIYKHWLNAVLFYVYGRDEIDPYDMRDKLYTLACTYMSDRYLTDRKRDFEQIIYLQNFMPDNYVINWDFINNGCDVENFIFNFYDYITWKNDPGRYRYFEFSYRTSVEHFYPQTPQKGYDRLEDDVLNSFGNLCLISRGMNSKFSNNMPVAKLKNFGNDEMTKELSLKLNEMMDITKKKGDWQKEDILSFERNSKERILNAIITACEMNKVKSPSVLKE